MTTTTTWGDKAKRGLATTKTTASRWAMRGFYTTAAGSALVGQVTGATESLDLPLAFATPAVAVVEFAGIMLAHHAQERRRIGEKAYAAQIASAAVVGWAIGFQLAAHSNVMFGRYFAGLSALAYIIYLLDSGGQRRDARRASNDMRRVAPDYGWYQWIWHPGITRRAKALALANPELGVLGSLKAVEDEDRNKARSARVADVLDEMIEESLGKKRAKLAREVYDLGRIADGLTEGADYDRLIKLIAAQLVPGKIVPNVRADDHDVHCTSKGAFGRYTERCAKCTALSKAKKRGTRKPKVADTAPVETPVPVPAPPKLERPQLVIANDLREAKAIWELEAVGAPGSPAPSGAQHLHN